MQKWLVVYSSGTGNTKKIAEAFYNALEENEGELYALKDLPKDISLDDYDVIATGYWLTRGAPDMTVQKFLGRLTGKNVVLFQTQGAVKGTEHSVTAFARAASRLGADCHVLGTFACQGKINPDLLARRVSGSPDDPHAASPENLKRWATAAQHPNTQDFEDTAAFVQAMKRKIKMRRVYLEKRKK